METATLLDWDETSTATAHPPYTRDWVQNDDADVVFGENRWKAIVLKEKVREPYFPLLDLSEIKHDYYAALALLRHTGTEATKEDIPTTTQKPPDAEREALKTEVYELLKMAGIENWDGEGGLAVTREIVSVAQKFVDKLPNHLGKPDVAATPQGEIDFDWVINPDVMLTVSIGPSNEIAFAGLFHGARLNGGEPWTGILPQFVDCCFKRLRDSLKR